MTTETKPHRSRFPMTSRLIFFLATLVTPLPALEQQVLWTSGTDGYHTYRIPALLATPQGALVAFCEGRKNGAGDHGDIDLLMKRSEDGGLTWSEQVIVHEEGGQAAVTIGNPCPVADRTTGTIWLPFTRDNKAVFLMSSLDGGRTWSPAREISATAMRPDWDWVATGPGIGIQLSRGAHRGRLVIPCDHKRGLKTKTPELNSHMMFSDDGGETWHIGAPIQTGGNECQVVELEDGRLLVNIRMHGDFRGWRGIASSEDGGTTWTPIVHDGNLPCPKCQASLLRLGDGSLLFANPDPGTKPGARVNLTLRHSPDEGKSWPVAKILREGPCGYSCLAELADRTILCLYETGSKDYRETITLARLSRDWLAIGREPVNPPIP